MPKEIIAKNEKTHAVYRFIKRGIFLKCNNLQYASQLVQQIKDKGGKVTHRRNWMLCDIIGSHDAAILGPYKINVLEDSDEKIEETFYNFFLMTLQKAGFKCEGKDILK